MARGSDVATEAAKETKGAGAEAKGGPERARGAGHGVSSLSGMSLRRYGGIDVGGAVGVGVGEGEGVSLGATTTMQLSILVQIGRWDRHEWDVIYIEGYI